MPKGWDEQMVTYMAAEIASQPECWKQAVAQEPQVRDHLPRVGERVAVVGCGTSWFMAMAYAVLRESAGLGETDAFAASEVPAGRAYDRVVALSRSGTTTEVLDLLGSRDNDVPAVVITAVPDSPAVGMAGNAVVLDYADEQSVVQTRFATTTLALLRAHLGHDMNSVIADAESAATRDLSDLMAVDQVTYVAQGWAVGLAHEAALKLRESAQFWAEAYPAMEYRHGPIAIAQPGRLVWSIGPAPAGLAGDVADTGATWIAEEGIDPMAELVVAQRFAGEVARARGLDPDRPRNLTRSVVLAQD